MAKRKEPVNVEILANFGAHKRGQKVVLNKKSAQDMKALAMWEERGWARKAGRPGPKPKATKAPANKARSAATADK